MEKDRAGRNCASGATLSVQNTKTDEQQKLSNVAVTHYARHQCGQPARLLLETSGVSPC